MVIYADIIFLVNSASSYMMLLLLGKIISRQTSLIRELIAAAVGASGATLIFCSDIPYGAALLLKIFICAIMSVAAFNIRGKDAIGVTIIFIFLQYAFSGLAFVFISVLRSDTLTLIRGGILYFGLTDFGLIAVIAASYYAAFAVFRMIKRKREAFALAVTLGGKEASTTALYDSGNLLKDPQSGKNVIIAEWEAIKELFGFEYDEIFSHADEYSFSVIPYSSLGNPAGIIPVFTADSARIDNRTINKPVIGVSKTRLCKNNSYHALVGNGFMI